MSSVAKAQPGDRTASVEPDEASVAAAENSWKSSSRLDSEHHGDPFPYMGEHDDEDAEDATEEAPPAYQFHESLTIRDFGFPTSDPGHYGNPGHHSRHQHHSDTSPNGVESDTSDMDSSTTAVNHSGQATALYDFDAENPSELSFREGQTLNILFRQCAGWLVGEMEVEEEEGDGGGSSVDEQAMEERAEQIVVGGDDQADESKGTMIKVGGTGAKRKKVVKIKKGLVPENYVEIWGS